MKADVTQSKLQALERALCLSLNSLAGQLVKQAAAALRDSASTKQSIPRKPDLKVSFEPNDESPSEHTSCQAPTVDRMSQKGARRPLAR